MKTVKLITFNEILEAATESDKKILLNWIEGADGEYLDYIVHKYSENKVDILLKTKFKCKDKELIFIQL